MEATVLALSPVLLIHSATTLSLTRIGELVSECSVEEALTPFTGEYTVVPPRRRCVANCAFDVLVGNVKPVDLVKLRPRAHVGEILPDLASLLMSSKTNTGVN